MQLLYQFSSVKGLIAQPIEGDLEKHAALESLLRGTGLEAVYSTDNAATIRPVRHPVPAAAGPSLTGDANSGDADRNPPTREVTKPRKGFFHLAQAGTESGVGPASVTDDNGIPSHATGGRLEEVVVTARRREEDVQKVPETVQVISQQALLDQNVASVRDLQYLVPGLSGTNSTPNQIRLSLRGQGASGNASWPGVIMFLNEVPFPNPPGGGTSFGPGLFFDLENVQVLKGPQGTLFGKSSVGGDILLRSARPTKEPGGYVDVGVGNYNDREFDGAINIPIVNDKLLTRVAFMSQKRTGYTEILGTPSWPNGIDGDNRDAQSLRISVTYRPTDWFQNETIWTDAEFTSRGTYAVLTMVVPGGPFETAHPGVTALLALQQSLGIRTILPISVDPVANGFTKSLTNITEFKLGKNLSLKNIAGYHEENNTMAGDQDNTAFAWSDVYNTPLSKSIWQYSDELQLVGNSFQQHLDWVFGGFYLDQPDRPGEPSHYDIENIIVSDNKYYATRTDGQESKAVYAHAIYDLSNKVHGLKLSAGLRSSQDSFSHQGYSGVGNCTGPVSACNATGGHFESSGSSRALTWTAGVEDQLSSRTLGYLTASKGYRPGGTNSFNASINFQPPAFDPEYVLEIELGIKSDWMLGGIPIRTNGNLWHQDYTGIQEQVLHPNPFGAYTQNAGTATLWGAELEADAQLTPNLDIGINYGHGEIKYTSFLPGVDAGAIDQLQKTRTFNFPPNKLNAQVRYRLPIAADVGNVSVQANYNWQDTSGWEGIVNNLGMQKAFGILNLSAHWDSVYGKPCDIEVIVSNATDKAYTTEAVQAWQPLYVGYGNEIYGEPRMYALRLKYRFGVGAK